MAIELTHTQKESLSKYLNGVTEIYFSIKESLLIAKRLNSPKNDMESEYIKYDTHLSVIIFSLWKNCIIDISKLVTKGKNNHYNIYTLISEFKTNGQFYNGKITCTKIVEWETKMKALSFTIDNLKSLRSKSYAHTDRDRQECLIDINITIVDFETLLELISEIFKYIYCVIYLRNYKLETLLEGLPFVMIERLSYSRERELFDPAYRKLIFCEE